MLAHERLLKYVKVSTPSDDKSSTNPTTACQFDLAKVLVEEMKALGIEDARVDDKCYVYGTIPATAGYEDKAKVGFIAHMDTAPDFCGENVNPCIIENYDGKDVVLGESGRVLSVEQFPHLAKLAGRTLITTDGTTLLGSDDKSGIAEILTAAERILKDNTPHGKICIAFTPDEEVGQGADHFDVEGFGADFAYTVDGAEEGEIVYENFNAYSAIFTVNGVNVHPGSAKNIMRNAQLVAMELNGMLPAAEVPECTENYEGFYHLCEMKGDVEKTTMEYIVRDHSAVKMENRLDTIRHIVKVLNEKYGEGTVEVVIEEEYRNMEEMIRPVMHVVDNAKKVIKELGMEPITLAERGGTDGARLSFMGLPCPNLGTGGYAFHGPYEHVTVEGMEKCVEIIVGIIKEYAK